MAKKVRRGAAAGARRGAAQNSAKITNFNHRAPPTAYLAATVQDPTLFCLSRRCTGVVTTERAGGCLGARWG